MTCFQTQTNRLSYVWVFKLETTLMHSGKDRQTLYISCLDLISLCLFAFIMPCRSCHYIEIKRRCAWDRMTLVICQPVYMWMKFRHVFSPRLFSMGPQMTGAHAEPFRKPFILIWTSRGWNRACLVSLHPGLWGPIRAAIQSRDETPRRWFTTQRSFIACG